MDHSIVDLMTCTESQGEDSSVQQLTSTLEIPTIETFQKEQAIPEDSFTNEAALSNLSHDLLLYIFSVCDARTIGILRQCCKEFNKLSHVKVVWLKVLETTAAELNIPRPSFQRNECSSLEVELLATAWIRFQQALRTGKHGKPPLHKKIRSIHTGTAVAFGLEQSKDGRFLFVADTAGVRVWNLHSPSPVLMGSFEMEFSEDTWAKFSVQTLSDNGYLVYLCVFSPSPRMRQRLCFRFTFSAFEGGENQLDLLSTLDFLAFPAKRWGCWFTKTYSPLFYTWFEHSSGGRHYLLWDAVSGTCATWAADGSDALDDPIIFMINDFIIAFENESQAMVVYARPDIPPKSSYAPEVCAKLNNSVLLDVPAKYNRQSRSVGSKLFWKSHPNRGHLISNHGGTTSIHNAGDDNWVLQRVEIFQANSSSSTFAPLPLQCEISCSKFSRFLPIARGSSGYADVFIDESILLHVTSRDKIVFHLSSPKEQGEGVELCRGILYDSGGVFDLNVRNYSLSSFSGRLCVIIGDEIEVVDFVEFPYLETISTARHGET